MKRLAFVALFAVACAHAPEKVSFEQAAEEQFPPELRREAMLAKPSPMIASAGNFLPQLPQVFERQLAAVECTGVSAACSASSFTTAGNGTFGDVFVHAAGATNTAHIQTLGGSTYFYGNDPSNGYLQWNGTLWNFNSSGVGVTNTMIGGLQTTVTNGAANGFLIVDNADAKTLKVRNNNDAFEFYNTANTLLASMVGSTGTLQVPNGNAQTLAGGGSFASITSTLIGQFTIDATVHNSGADTTEDTLWTYSLPASSLSATGKTLRITAYGDGVSTADVTTVRCYFGATVVLSKVLTASQANTWHAVFEVTRTGATAQIASGMLNNGGTATSFVQSNTAPAETLSGAVVLKCTGQRATSSVANSVRQLYALGEFVN